MLKKSIIFIFIAFISYFYFITSCTSSSVQPSTYLKIDKASTPKLSQPYLTKIRIVAVSTNPSCPLNNKTKTLGTFTQESEISKSFNTESNFVNITPDTHLQLNPACFPYNVTVGYWCTKEPKLKTLKAGLCYINKNNVPVVVSSKNIVNFDNTSNLIQLKLDLSGQNGWDKAQELLETIKPQELSKLFDTDTCLFRDKNDYLYMAQKNIGELQQQNRRFYFFKKACLLHPNKLLKKPSSFTCTKTSEQLENTHYNFHTEKDLLDTLKTSGLLLTTIQIGDYYLETRFLDTSILADYLKEPVDDKFIVRVLTLPKNYKEYQNDNGAYLTWTHITCTKKQ